ncbi:MAG: hypothetical protein PHQ63_06500 [Smithellaceae bacterium]|jgi:hypothetical protein|nr:hypothetical protein [Smithellaceae bacterium]
MKRLVLFAIVAVFAFCTMAMAQVSTKEEVQSGATKISDADKAAVKDAKQAAKEKRAAKKAGTYKRTKAKAPEKTGVSTVDEVKSGGTVVSDEDKAAVKDAQKAAKEKRAAKKAGTYKRTKAKAPEKTGVSTVDEVQSGSTKISDADKAAIEAARKAKKAK